MCPGGRNSLSLLPVWLLLVTATLKRLSFFCTSVRGSIDEALPECISECPRLYCDMLEHSFLSACGRRTRRGAPSGPRYESGGGPGGGGLSAQPRGPPRVRRECRVGPRSFSQTRVLPCGGGGRDAG